MTCTGCTMPVQSSQPAAAELPEAVPEVGVHHILLQTSASSCGRLCCASCLSLWSAPHLHKGAARILLVEAQGLCALLGLGLCLNQLHVVAVHLALLEDVGKVDSDPALHACAAIEVSSMQDNNIVP